ncbi:MAG: chemotaxis protein CheC [Dehalococcoidia bacterium]
MNEHALAFWTEVAGRGFRRAMMNLSQLCGEPINVESFGLRRVEMTELPETMGGADAEAVGIYITISGPAHGHIMLAYDPGMALGFAEMLLANPSGSTGRLGDMERSALGELGNIMASSFLNVLGESTGLRLLPSPPIVLSDMAGALSDIIAADVLLVQDHAFLAQTEFRVAERSMSGAFIVVPRQDLLEVLLQHRSAA